MRRPIPKQSIRVIWVLLYGTALLLINYWLAGSVFPPPTTEAIWFYTALFSLILGDLIVHPYHVTPKDCLAAAVPVAVITWTVISAEQGGEHAWMTAALVYSLVACALAVGAILLTRTIRRDSPGEWPGRVKDVAISLGHPQAVLSALLVAAVVEFHLADPRETVIIIGAWALLVGVQPERTIYWLWGRIAPGPGVADDLGEIAGHRTPGLVLVRQSNTVRVDLGDFVAFRDSDGPPRLALALDYTGRDEGLLLRCMEISLEQGDRGWLKKAATRLGANRAGRLAKAAVPDNLASDFLSGGSVDSLIGIVDEQTDVQRLFFEIVEPRDIEEGHLVQVTVRGQPSVYQVVNGVTREDAIFRKHTHGYARAEAHKIGRWDSQDRRFVVSPWLPEIHSPVVLLDSHAVDLDERTIGCFPGTSYPVELVSVDDLVTHNTAVLGILGIGKSMLAIELVERILASGTQVVCLDLTDQYASELAPWRNANADREARDRIVQAGVADRQQLADQPEEGGSFPAMKSAIQEELAAFYAADDRWLMILNPSEFGATRQGTEPKQYKDDRGEWQRSAPLWSVTPVQVTQVVAETLLALSQDQMRDVARICLVLEEAHSLVPEWNNVANDADRNATNGTARAILQGRKYGFGCLVVTQRTANVTKTILNQCNTVFAMRTFDDTGKAFLSNYLGSAHAEILPTLRAREAVLFGKASNCENPIRVRLNDREDFLSRFRGERPEAVPAVDLAPNF